jgi:deoxyribonuclease V
MRIHAHHSWDLTPREAVALQRRLAGQIDSHSALGHVDVVAGADVSYGRFSNIFYAGVVVLRKSDWTVIEKQEAVRKSPFPYIPGLLSFRELPALLDAFAKVKAKPDAVMYDGHGLAHPRRFGIASHLGLLLRQPCLGCGKSRLTGQHEEPDRQAGAVSPLMDRDEVIGQVVRTKTGVKPVFVSVGHRIDLASAVALVLESCRGYRLPEPTRQAHLHVNSLRREASPRNP